MGQIGKKQGIITVVEPLKAPLVIPLPVPEKVKVEETEKVAVSVPRK